MMWTSLDTWIVVAGILCAMACALVGNFLVLRKMSMMGDAISHAVLPGLAAAFLLTGSRASLPMFIGAAVVGVLTAVFTEWIRRFGKVEESASMGVVFTALFAIGLIMIVQAADAVDLDPGCVLYGAIELTPLDTVRVAGVEMPRAVATLAVVLAINVLFVLLFYKELKISSFDAALATTLGINATIMHYLLMTLVAITTVASFESVGSILVVAMLIVPGAAAHLLTDRLPSMLVVSLVFAAVSAVLGHIAAITVPTWFGFADTSTAGMMALMAGLLFGVVMLVAPRYGVLSKLFHRAALSIKIAAEDILGLLYRLEERRQGHPVVQTANDLHALIQAGPLTGRLAILRLNRSGSIRSTREGYGLTNQGRGEAQRIIRAHRLWEGYLSEHLRLPGDHLHSPAEGLEHITSEQMQAQLAAAQGRPEIDPQGKPIPPESQR